MLTIVAINGSEVSMITLTTAAAILMAPSIISDFNALGWIVSAEYSN